MNSNSFKNTVDKSSEESQMISFDEQRIAKYTNAMKNKAYLLGDVRVIDGMEADFSHFDFLLSTIKFPKTFLTDLQKMRMLWAENWKYLEPVLKAYEAQTESFDILLQDQDDVLKRYADQNLKLQVYQEYFEKVSPFMKKSFSAYYQKRKSEIDKQVEEVKAKEFNKTPHK